MRPTDRSRPNGGARGTHANRGPRARRGVVTTLFAASLFTLAACDGRPRDDTSEGETISTSSEEHLAELDLRRGAPEQATASLLGGAQPLSFSDLVMRLRTMPDEANMKGVLVRLGASMALAQSEEVGRHLGAVRAKGIPIVCHAHGYSNSTMLLAARACDEIFLSPAGGVDTMGLAGQLIFGRGLLDRLKVDVDFLQVGKFKGAKEPFTNTEASPEARSSLQAALTGMRDGLIDGVAKGRDKEASALGLEDGPHTPTEAKALGLIDEIGFLRDARKRALERANVKGRLDYFGSSDEPEGFAGLLSALAGAGGSGVPHVAVVRATGAITMSGGGSLFGGSGGITYSGLSQVIRKLEKNDATKAVVLRIDSPGGSALASDLLWRSLMDLREDKPLVVSIGSMAASGGYYLACAGNKVLAERTSIVGSIGVVAGKLSYGESLRELGVNVETVTPKGVADGNRALYGSPFIGWDDNTRAKLQSSIQSMYDLFIARIAEGRGVEASVITPSAEGRIMGGDAAKDGQLVDEIGGLSRAIEVAIELAGVDAATPIDIVRTDQGLLEVLGLEGAHARQVAIRDFEQRAANQARAMLTGGLLPFRNEIGAFAGSMQPLLDGERVIAALPYVLSVR